MTWSIFSKNFDQTNPVIQRLFKEAIAVAPSEYLKSSSKMLPRQQLVGPCRLCGKHGKLSKEHVPTFASGNKLRHTVLTMDDWLKNHLNEDPNAHHPIQQGGIFGYTLCEECNKFTGTLYGNEYKEWSKRGKVYLSKLGPDIAILNNADEPASVNIVFANKELGSLKPGAFVRQVLSVMCSISGDWNLAGYYPAVRRIVRDQSTEPLPAGMDLGMSLFVGPKVRICGPQLSIDPKTQTWRWIEEIAFPPFAFLLVIASNKKEAGSGLMMNDMTLLAPDKEQYYDGVVDIGFGWSPHPGDYRSKGNMLSDRKVSSIL